MITILGNGWAELSFYTQKTANDKPIMWKTYGRVIHITDDQSKALVEYYNVEQVETRTIFELKS